ncbi:MAG: glycosyltransferase [Clostridia bacterium]|nr:glycosyltransferase [Clostridia bacterium]
MISVIVPVYKVEAFLPACLDSLLSQTVSDWEAILVDDGSPDS